MRKAIKGWQVFFVAGFLSLFLMQSAAAETVKDPIPELQKISDQMLAALKKDKATITEEPQQVYKIVEAILLPHVDLTVMARSALGRTAWVSATPDQQKAFTEQFKLKMLKTYASGLSTYTNEKIIFFPIRGGIPAGTDRVEVNSQIIRHDGPPIAVSYRLKYEANNWFVYDFSIEGVGIVNSFNAQFASKLSAGETVADLTQTLKKQNEKPV